MHPAGIKPSHLQHGGRFGAESLVLGASHPFHPQAWETHGLSCWEIPDCVRHLPSEEELREPSQSDLYSQGQERFGVQRMILPQSIPRQPK